MVRGSNWKIANYYLFVSSRPPRVTLQVKLEVYYCHNNEVCKQTAAISNYNGKYIQIWAAFPAITESHAPSLSQHGLNSFWNLISQWWGRERQRDKHTLVIPKPHLIVEKVGINLDVSSTLDSRQDTEPLIKVHNNKCKICSMETNGLLQVCNTTTATHHLLTFSVA